MRQLKQYVKYAIIWINLKGSVMNVIPSFQWRDNLGTLSRWVYGNLWTLQLPPSLHASYTFTNRTDSRECNEVYTSTVNANDNQDLTELFKIDSYTAYNIEQCLQYDHFIIFSDRSIKMLHSIHWDSQYSLFIISKNSIIFEKDTVIKSDGLGSVSIKAGENNLEGRGTVKFLDNSNKQVIMGGNGKINIYYNPEKGCKKYKYHNPTDFSVNVEPLEALTAFMLVNNAEDLQNISFMLHASFALSQDIQLPTNALNDNGNFQPITRFLKPSSEQRPFSGVFDGAWHSIKGLVVKFPTANKVGLFSFCSGTEYSHAEISNLVIEDCIIRGNLNVGSICGASQYTDINNVRISDCYVRGNDKVGGVVGSIILSHLDNIIISNMTILASQGKNSGVVAGTAIHSSFTQILEDNAESPLVGDCSDSNVFK